MKILFLLFHGFYADNGISKKITAQVKALKAAGAEVHVCHYDVLPDGRRQWLVDDRVIKDFGCGAKAKLLKRLDFSAIEKEVLEGGYDMLYYRYFHNANPLTTALLNHVRKAGVKVVVEVPTFPYDGEFITRKEKIEGLMDKTFRHSFFSKADWTVSFSEVDNIFGCPAIVISNGIDLEAIPLRKDHPMKDGELHMIAVAEIHFWHGFDRILTGMADYYAKGDRDVKVYLDLVGEPYGKLEKDTLEGLVRENGLEEYVTFCGRRHGDELDALFDKADIAIGSLGRHRSGVYTMNSLKNREYCARGFRFVYAENDPDFDQAPFVLKMPADESPADISKIVSFAQSCIIAPEQIREAAEPLDWKHQMAIFLERSTCTSQHPQHR